MSKLRLFSVFVLLVLLLGVGLLALMDQMPPADRSGAQGMRDRASRLWFRIACAITVRLPARPLGDDAPFSQTEVEADRLLHEASCTQNPDQKQALLVSAAELYTEVLRDSPENASIYITRGATYAQLGRYDQAVADYTAALRISPKSADALKNRGLAYERQGNLRAALADYETFLSMIEGTPTERRADERVRFADKIQALRAQLGDSGE